MLKIKRDYNFLFKEPQNPKTQKPLSVELKLQNSKDIICHDKQKKVIDENVYEKVCSDWTL